ncbi:adenine phosphoribosyltransferase [Gregarina niphandrodes]|uniref:adenine phosphoribosyltransferase n=1 Tax=Gregarina niphandrodes TaxID=110365 RepID=A0A023B158_GRENI|nr:adenine phosphoribosyltransferase [Gregarina niphandrodes]EZG46103.1 adenine phosphoribosyltransferase [Gregarina niphandrodes]|eukprot:XP_011132359.1 adenine phosphoribosyltransferase [Gregarina niphandrodes]
MPLPNDGGLTAEEVSLLRRNLREFPDFPKEGIVFLDVLPLLAVPELYKLSIKWFRSVMPSGIDMIVGPESRGFLFACPLALETGTGFVPARKPGKLPGERVQASYALEYGEATLAVQTGMITPGMKVFLVDDVLATGGTLAALKKIVEQCGATVVKAACLMNIAALPKTDVTLTVETLFDL